MSWVMPVLIAINLLAMGEAIDRRKWGKALVYAVAFTAGVLWLVRH